MSFNHQLRYSVRSYATAFKEEQANAGSAAPPDLSIGYMSANEARVLLGSMYEREVDVCPAFRVWQRGMLSCDELQDEHNARILRLL